MKDQKAKPAEGLRERLGLFYGWSNRELERAVRMRYLWRSTLFSPSDEIISEQEALNQEFDDPIGSFNRGICHEVFASLNSDDVGVYDLFDCVVNDHLLKPHETRFSSVSTILNVGAPVLCMDWKGEYLAVGVAADQQPLNVESTHISKGDTTLIFLYKVLNGKPTLISTLTGMHGVCTSILWSPNSHTLLVVCTQAVGIIRIPKEIPSIVEFKLRNLCSSSLGSPVCACWPSETRVIVGFSQGYISEYDISGPPSVVYSLKCHDALVASISCGAGKLANRVLSTGADGFLKVYDRVDLRLSFQIGQRLRLYSSRVGYAPLADSFIVLDSDVAKLVSARHPEEDISSTTLTKSPCNATTCSASASHPLIACGTQDGTLFIANVLRRTMATPRSSRDCHYQCALWRLECSDLMGKMRFVELLDAELLNSTKHTQSTPVFPVSVNITCCSWAKTWCATGCAGGLIRFDNVNS